MTKTQTIINRILNSDNMSNLACVCADWAEFLQEIEEWGVYHLCGIDLDDTELHLPTLNQFIKAENGYVRGAA